MKARKLSIDLKEIGGIKEIKDILWKLYYNPQEALKNLNLESVDQALVVECILNQCIEEGIDLKFGTKEPHFDTLGVDLGFKHAVVRDKIIEMCYQKVHSDIEAAIKVARLLKTPETYYEYEKKVIGGLKELKFSNVEAKYLFETCDLRSTALFLFRLVEKQRTVGVEALESWQKEEVVEEKPKSGNESEDSVLKLLKNKEEIEAVFLLLRDERNEKEVQAFLHNAKKEVERLEILENKVQELKSKGISFDEIVLKKEKIVKVFEATDCL